jgi:general secretion pathway protein K
MSLKSNSRRQGSILVLVLIILSSLIVLSVGLAYRVRIDIKLAQANARRTQVYYLALGGIERIKALLNGTDLSPSTIGVLCCFTGTAKQESLFEQIREFEAVGEKVLAYSLRDEQGYLNVNKSDPASWENIGSIGSECRSGIVDWIDADDDTSPDGAETDFYERLDPPYISKDSPCVALKELLFVKGLTRDIYLGENLNRNSLSYENKIDAQLQLATNSAGSNLNPGMVNLFTVYGSGKININTASGAILAALPGLDEQAANVILAYRAGPDGQSGTEDDMYFSAAEDFAKVEGLTELQIELLQQYCCFDSEYFRIFSYARSNDGFQCCLMATVRCSESQMQVLYLERLL